MFDLIGHCPYVFWRNCLCRIDSVRARIQEYAKVRALLVPLSNTHRTASSPFPFLHIRCLCDICVKVKKWKLLNIKIIGLAGILSWKKKLLMCRKKNSLLLNRIVYVYRGLRQLDNARDYIKHIVFRKTVQLLYPVPSTNRMYAVWEVLGLNCTHVFPSTIVLSVMYCIASLNNWTREGWAKNERKCQSSENFPSLTDI